MEDGAWTEEWYREAEESVKRLQESRQRREDGFSGPWEKGEGLGIPDDPRWLTDNPDTRRKDPEEDPLDWWAFIRDWNKILRWTPTRKEKERNAKPADTLD